MANFATNASGAKFLAGEITQAQESIPWVRCASGNVYSLGCMRTWGQTEGPHIGQLAMDKKKIAIQIFPIFNDRKQFFLAWGLGIHINV